jgi:hypothetical protein
MALVHDDDLALLDGLGYNTVSRSLYCHGAPTISVFSCTQSREALQPDVELSYLRSSKPFIHEVLFGSGEFLPVSKPLYFSQ